MDKLKMHSPDLVNLNLEKIGALFPNCITETRDEKGKVKIVIDFDLLKQELSHEIIEEGKERYQLNWPGKRGALVTANTPVNKTLRPCREESVDFDTTKNLFIEGDNLEVLKLLQENYLGKIKMIYIDPPYNTGKDFIYNDRFKAEDQEYNLLSGLKDEKENKLIDEEKFKQNLASNGRFHSDWLSMMYPRLRLARNLLKDDGVIFISIDDNEVHNLRKICDEIFGSENFIDQIIWKKRYGGGAKEKYLVSLHEYVVIYVKNIEQFSEIFIPLSEENIKKYYTLKDVNFNLRGPYRTHPLEAGSAVDNRPNLIFDIIAPDGSVIRPKRQWYWSKERVEEAIKNNEIEFIKGRDGTWSVHSKQYLKDEDGNMRQAKAFSLIDDVYSQHGTNEAIDIFGNAKFFSYPKPSILLKQLINIGLNNVEATILDFFSGSCTTAQAVMQLNAEDGGNRKFIMVQLPEPCDEKSEAYIAGFKNIAEIGKERIRRAGQKIKEENPIGTHNLDTGFRVLKADSSNMEDIFYTPDKIDQGFLPAENIKPDRTAEDLLFQVLLDWGVDLTLPIRKEEVNGFEVYFVDENALVACFVKDGSINSDFIKILAERKPLRVVFRDAGFGNDSIKINTEQIFANLSPNTEIKTI